MQNRLLTIMKFTLILFLFIWITSCGFQDKEYNNTENGGPIEDVNYDITTQKNESVWWIDDWFTINQ